MSVQGVKWFILFVVICISITETCQTNVRTRESDTPASSIESIDNPSTNFLDSLVSLLHFTSSGLNEQITHLDVNKKAFALLLIYLKDHNNFLKKSCCQGTDFKLPFNNPHRKAYYIYTLHKIII